MKPAPFYAARKEEWRKARLYSSRAILQRSFAMKSKMLPLILMFATASALSAQTRGPVGDAAQGEHHEKMTEMRKQEVQKMKADIEKMKASLAAMKANLATVRDTNELDRWRNNVDLWQTMVDHMEQMQKHIESMGPGMHDHGTGNPPEKKPE